MLTVKYIFPYGDEEVFAVQSVRKIGRKACDSKSPLADVLFERAPGSGPGLIQVASGTVYVMNEAGKTVATYELGSYCDYDEPKRAAPANKTFTTLGGLPQELS